MRASNIKYGESPIIPEEQLTDLPLPHLPEDKPNLPVKVDRLPKSLQSFIPKNEPVLKTLSKVYEPEDYKDKTENVIATNRSINEQKSFDPTYLVIGALLGFITYKYS